MVALRETVRDGEPALAVDTEEEFDRALGSGVYVVPPSWADAMAWHPWDEENTDSLEDVLATDDDPDPTQEDASAPLPESGHMPDWAQDDPRTYWAAADAHERANGRLFRDVEFALPTALPERQQVALAREFAASVTNSGGERLPYTLAVHHGEGENAHAHLMFSERAHVGIRDGGGAGLRPRTAAVLWRQAIEGTLRDFWLAQETAAAVVSSEPRLPPPPVRTQSHCPARRPPLALHSNAAALVSRSPHASTRSRLCQT